MPPGTVATVQNYLRKKKERPHQNWTVDEQWEALYDQWQNTVAA